MGVKEDVSRIPVWGFLIGFFEWLMDLSGQQRKTLLLILCGLIFGVFFIFYVVYL